MENDSLLSYTIIFNSFDDFYDYCLRRNVQDFDTWIVPENVKISHQDLIKAFESEKSGYVIFYWTEEKITIEF